MIKRLSQITYTVIAETLDQDMLPYMLAPSRLLALFSSRMRTKSRRSAGEKCVSIAARLGPLFIKLGQFLSTRADLLPPDITHDLQKLQDNVAPIDITTIKSILNEKYSDTKSVFADFCDEPIASASIAQVHAATLLTGEKVVVKVRRPNLESRISSDLSVLRKIAQCVNRLTRHAKPLRLLDILSELQDSLNQEIHLLNEAGHYAQMQQNFKNSEHVYIPSIYWDYCYDNVLVIEYVTGCRVNDLKKLQENDVNLHTLAKRGVELFFTQLVRYRYFHADMHPGNIFIDIDEPENPKFIPIDFGIMGYLSEDDQYYITQNLAAFLQRDFRKIAELHIESGWVPAETRLFDLEASVRGVCLPLLDKPLGEISFAEVLKNLIMIGKQYNMVVQPQLILLQKTLFSVEGIGRQLCPDINVWEIAKPFMKEIQAGPTLTERLEYAKKKIPKWLDTFRPQKHNFTVSPTQKHIPIKVLAVLTVSVCAYMLDHELVSLALIVGFVMAL